MGEVADFANGTISLCRGDFLDAGLSFASMIPVVGDVIGKGGKVAKGVVENADVVVKNLDEASKKTVESQRRQAVKQAWKDEKNLIEHGGREAGTRRWTRSEEQELLQNGKVKNYHGHHINNVKDHPEMAGNPDNIEFLTPGEHLDVHGGNFRNKTEGNLLNRKRHEE